jgi:hypothetical protein
LIGVSCSPLRTASARCSFLLFMPYIVTRPEPDSSSNTSSGLVQTATYTCVTSAPAVMSHTNYGFFWQYWKEIRRRAIVLQGGAIHWLMRHRGECKSLS